MLAGASDVKEKVDIRFGSLLKMKSLKQRAIKVNDVRRCALFIFAMDYGITEGMESVSFKFSLMF